MKIVLLVSVLCGGLFAQSSLDIAMRSYEAISGFGSSISKTTMVLKNAQGSENIRKLEIKKLETESGERSLIDFLYPLDIKNTKLLSFEQIGGGDKQWLYLPALKRVKRISSGNRSGSFMASEFSYEDIASQNYKNYVYDGEAEKVKKEGREYFKITRIPIDGNSGYSRQIVYIDTGSYLARFGEYYDKQERLLKEITFLEYRKLGDVYRVKKISMYNVQTEKSSLLIWDEDSIGAGLEPDDFSERALK